MTPISCGLTRVRLDRRQELRDVLGVGLPDADILVQSHVRRLGLGEHRLLFDGRCHAVELGDECPRRDLAVMRDMRGGVAAETRDAVPMGACRPRRSHFFHAGFVAL